VAARDTLATYYTLTKPGIIRGNAITAAAGFLLAARGQIDFSRFVAMLAGLSLVIASGCVCNNYMDRTIDRKMTRTRNRALAAGHIASRSALFFATVLGVVGTIILVVGTNLLTACLAAFGFLAYVFIYGLAKRTSVHGTIVGSVSGAIPPVVGYCAVHGRLDLGALLIFLILVLWQMPHFYAIAMYRRSDYAAAGIPVLPVQSGHRVTRIQIVIYVVGFILACTTLTIFGYSGYLYLAISLLLGVTWLYLGVRGMRKMIPGDPAADDRWAHQMFGFSLLVITGLCLAIGIDSLLPR
jgi:protoheme IX farnesyltransferase